jgi:cbb3-type cytochrome oxidase subunit 3
MFQKLFLEMESLTLLPVIGMLIFFTIFIGVLVRISQRSRSPQYERMAALPLADESDKGGNDDD